MKRLLHDKSMGFTGFAPDLAGFVGLWLGIEYVAY